jgi:hypothetical protein
MKLYFIIYLFLLLRFQMRLNRISHKPIYQSLPLNRRSKRWNRLFFALKSVPQERKLKLVKKIWSFQLFYSYLHYEIIKFIFSLIQFNSKLLIINKLH